MLEKWKQRAIKMNLRKAAIAFIITVFALAIASSAALYSNFRGRISDWEQSAETDREHEREDKDFDEEHKSGSGDREYGEDLKDKKEKEWEDIQKELHLSAGDLALIAGCGIIGLALGVWYWILIMMWAYRKSYHMGVSTMLWVLAALVFNLVAIAALYLYAVLKGTCKNCGRIRSGNAKFCDRCGNRLKTECPQCGQEIDASSVYCGSCGKKMNENKQ